MKWKAAILASLCERKRFWSSSSHSSTAKKLSRIASSWASPTEPVDRLTPASLQRLPQAGVVYRALRSLWWMTFSGLRAASAMSRASTRGAPYGSQEAAWIVRIRRVDLEVAGRGLDEKDDLAPAHEPENPFEFALLCGANDAAAVDGTSRAPDADAGSRGADAPTPPARTPATALKAVGPDGPTRSSAAQTPAHGGSKTGHGIRQKTISRVSTRPVQLQTCERTVLGGIARPVDIGRVDSAPAKCQNVDDPADQTTVVDPRLAAGVFLQIRCDPREPLFGQRKMMPNRRDLLANRGSRSPNRRKDFIGSDPGWCRCRQSLG